MQKHEIVAGALAGFFNDAILHPLDTIRARLDLSGGSDPRVRGRGFTGVIREVINTDGFRGFYRGYKLAIVTSIPINALYFSSFRFFQRHLSSSSASHADGINGAEAIVKNNGDHDASSGFVADSLAGLSAELLAALFWTPTDVLKQRMQVDLGSTNSSHHSNFNGALDLCKQLGIRGLYRGYILSVFVWGPFSSLYFATYEALRARLGRREGSSSSPSPHNRFYVSLVSGVLAGAAAGAATQPLDCVRTRMQVSARGTEGKGAVRIVQEILASEGISALFRGTFARVLWLAPGCGISLAVFETTSLLLKNEE